MDVQADHRIVAFGNDRMILFDAEDGNVIVECDREDDQHPWIVKPENGDPAASTASRTEAIQEMVNLALSILPGTGYSCIVPHGLSEMP